MSITLSALQKQRRDTAANWTAANPTLLAGELGYESDTGKWKVGDGSTVWNSLGYEPWSELSAYPIVNADISATAEIAVSKLADGTARQLLQTDAAGTGVEWASNIDVPGTLDVTGVATFDNNVIVQGDLTVNGTTTTIDTANLVVEDKNIEIGKVATPTDVTADGGGITLKGTTDKTITWVDATDAWTFSEHVNIASGKEYRIAGTKVLDATSLGSGVVSSSLTSVGTIGTGVWNGTTIGTGYGGTGIAGGYANGELLIGKTDGTLAKATLTAGSGVTITNGNGSITVNATGTGGTVTAVTGTSPIASTGGTTPDISIQDGTTAQKGAVQLEDSTSSTSTTKAATPASVKAAYDLAAAALDSGDIGVTVQGYDADTAKYDDATANFTGTLQNGGSNVVVDTDIGVSVQGFDADTAKLDVAQTFTAAQTFGDNVTLNAQSDLRFADSDSTNWVAFQAPATVASNVTWTLPAADGTTGQVLSTNGTGTLNWATATGTSDKISEGNTEAEVVDTGSDGHFKVTTEGSERLRVDPSGRLLVGTSSGSAAASITVQGNSASSTGEAILRLCRGTTSPANGDELGQFLFGDSNQNNCAVFGAYRDGGTWNTSTSRPTRLTFSTTADGASSPTERVRISQNGDVGLFASTATTGVQLGVSSGAGTSVAFISCWHSATSTTSLGTLAFRVWSNGNAVNINNSYGSISDAKLKENIVDAGSQWGDIKALKVRKYNFKEGQTHTQIGLIAQEVELVSPGLVSEAPDLDADGNDLGTVTKGVNYSVLYMKAVKALQEAMERIETLEAKVAALESA